MEDMLSKSIVEKLDAQENKIKEMQTAINKFPEQQQRIGQIEQDVRHLKSASKNISFPTEQMRQLTQTLAEFREQLNELLKTKESHFRLVLKFLVTGIVLLAAIFYTGWQWYLTHQELSTYKASDTKYRFLKLNGSKPLRELLLITDSLYRANPGMRDSVLLREEVIREQWELQQQIQEKESQLKDLKEKKKKIK